MIEYEENNHETGGRTARYGCLFWKHFHDNPRGSAGRDIRVFQEGSLHERRRVCDY